MLIAIMSVIMRAVRTSNMLHEGCACGTTRRGRGDFGGSGYKGVEHWVNIHVFFLILFWVVPKTFHLPKYVMRTICMYCVYF